MYDILVNKSNKLNYNYIPDDLIIINDNNDKLLNSSPQKNMIRKIAYNDFIQFQKHAKINNIFIIVDSGYRSYMFQKELFDYYKNELGDLVYKRVALEGCSEHQTGLAIDLAFTDGTEFNENDKRVKWLEKNSYKYGFILRYPLGKENITGYNYEPWHFRYVGKSLAKKLYKENLTLEEYYSKIK